VIPDSARDLRSGRHALDTEDNYYEADRRVLAAHGSLSARRTSGRYIGGSTRDMMIDVSGASMCGETGRAHREQAPSTSRSRERTVCYPEMARLLELVTTRVLPVAIASGSSPGVLRTVLEAVGLIPGMEVVVSAEEVPRGKPHPDVFEEAARRLGIPAHECVAVETRDKASRPRSALSCAASPSRTRPISLSPTDSPWRTSCSRRDEVLRRRTPRFAGSRTGSKSDHLLPRGGQGLRPIHRNPTEESKT